MGRGEGGGGNCGERDVGRVGGGAGEGACWGDYKELKTDEVSAAA